MVGGHPVLLHILARALYIVMHSQILFFFLAYTFLIWQNNNAAELLLNIRNNVSISLKLPHV